MRDECSNCRAFSERHWNANHTFEIGRCLKDKKKRQTIAKDPEVMAKTKCNDYEPIDPNWIAPKHPPRTHIMINVVPEPTKPKRQSVPKKKTAVKKAPSKGGEANDH